MRCCLPPATRFCTLSLAVATLLACSFESANCLAQARYRTANFEVSAGQPAFAKKIGDEAERYRKELAELWLGHELPTWNQRCPIQVKIEPHAGGETSFAFSPGRDGTSMPFDWRMKIFGSPERLLDSVLPHEVTHTIFATHFGRPLPRWADEGACTTVEHSSERKKNHQMLIEFLTTNRGIPFNHMFAMKQYPSDILPLYAQGYSLARFFIQQKGHRHFVKFVGEGMQREVRGQEPATWNAMVKKYYGYQHLSDLQVTWQAWVKKGCPDMNSEAAEVFVASNVTPKVSSSPQNNAYVAQTNNPRPMRNGNIGSKGANHMASTETTRQNTSRPQSLEQGSWYARQSKLGDGGRSGSKNTPSATATAPASSGYAPGSVGKCSDGNCRIAPSQSRRSDTRPPPTIPTQLARNPKTVWR